MAKETLTLDEFEFDQDLDSTTTKPVDIKPDPDVTKDDRRSVTRAFKGAIGTDYSPKVDQARIERLTKRSLPKTYGDIEEISEADPVPDVYRDAVTEVKPILGRITKQVSRLIPSRLTRLIDLQDRSREYLLEARKTKTLRESDEIFNALSAVFQAKSDEEEQVRAADDAQQAVDSTIQTNRYEKQLGLLSSIETGVSRFAQYNDTVGQAFQRKLIEINYRSYFVQRDLLALTARHFKTTEVQGSAIVKNTGLPDFVKMRKTETFAELARRRLLGNLQTRLFGTANFFTEGLEALKLKTLNTLGNLRQVVPQERVPSALARGWSSVPSIGNRAYNAPILQPKEGESPLLGGIKKAARWAIEPFSTEGHAIPVGAGPGLMGLTKPAVFDQKAHISLISVIPGYLARIYRELRVTRTGDESTDLPVFDFAKGTFTDKRTLLKGISTRLGQSIRADEVQQKTDQLLKTIVGQQSISKDDLEALRQQLTQMVVKDPVLDINKLVDILPKTIQLGDINQITKEFTIARMGVGNIRRDLKQLIEAGYGPILSEAGIISQAGNQYVVEKKAVARLIQQPVGIKETPATADVRRFNYTEHEVAGSIEDVYVQGESEPILSARKLRLGEYYDQLTGKVIRCLEDIRGPVVDHLGNLILGYENFKQGLVDRKGLPIRQLIDKFKGLRAERIGSWVGKPVSKLAQRLIDLKDMYVNGEIRPSLTVSKLNAGEYFDQITGKVIRSIEDIRGPVVDKFGNVVLAYEDFKRGLVTKDGAPVRRLSGRALYGLLSYIENVSAEYSKNMKRLYDVGRVVGKPVGKLAKWFFTGQDIYVNGEIKPALFYRKLTNGEYFDQSTGDPIRSVNDIRGPVVDKLGNVVVDREAFEKGLVYRTGTPVQRLTGSVLRGIFTYIDRVSQEYIKNLGRVYKVGKWVTTPIQKAAKWFLTRKKQKQIGGEPETPEGQPAGQGLNIGRVLKTAMLPISGLTSVLGKMLTGKDKEERKGGWKGRFEELKQRAVDRLKGRHITEAEKGPRYKSSENVLDMIAGKISGAYDTIKGGLSSLAELIPSGKGKLGKLGEIAKKAGRLGKLGEAASAVGTGAEVAGAAAGGGLASKALGMGKKAIGGVRAIGTPLAKGAAALGRVGMVSKAIRAVSAARTGLLGLGLVAPGAVGMVTGAAGTALTALGTFLASPVVLGTAAIALAGYGAYKLYGYMKNRKVRKLVELRLAQYGLPADDDRSKYIFELEQYLEENGVYFKNGQAMLSDKKIEGEKILEIFDIDPNDETQADRMSYFLSWFHNRFKPVYLTHLTALNGVEPTAQSLTRLADLDEAQKYRYLQASTYESGPYSVSASPFKDLDRLSVGKNEVLKAAEDAKAAIKYMEKEPTKAPAPKPTVVPPPPIPPIPEPSKAAGAINTATEFAKGFVKGVLPVNMQQEGEPSKLVGDASIKLSKADQSALSPQKVPIEQGPLSGGENADSYLKIQPQVNLEGIKPALLEQFRAMVQEYGEKTGKTVTVNSGYRSTEYQAMLHRKDPQMTAPPGRSLHEFGLALDVDSKAMNEMEALGLTRKYGFTRPVGAEPWHTEPAGIQVNLQKAKDDSDFATQAIRYSIGRGGGGYGTLAGADKAKRNTQLALSLLGTDVSEVTVAKGTHKEKIEEVLGTDTRSPIKTPAAPTGGTMEAAYQPATGAGEATPATYTGAPGAPTLTTRTRGSGLYGTGTVGEAYAASVPTMGAMGASIKAGMAGMGEPEPVNMGKVQQIEGPATPAKAELHKLIENVGEATGVDPAIMKTMAQIESGFGQNQAAKTSSARGIFQFIKSTWNSMLAKYGPKFGIGVGTSPMDPKANTLMASQYIKDNLQELKKVKPNPTATDVYLAHFLGSGGAKQFLRSNPAAIAAQAMPDAAKANRNIFFDAGRPRTIQEVYAVIDKKVQDAAKRLNIDLPSSMATAEPGYQATGKEITSIPAAPVKDVMPAVARQEMVPAARPITAVYTEPGSLVPTPPALPKPAVDVGTGLDRGTSGESLSAISDTLTQSLEVQNEMLKVLQQLASIVDPQKLSEALKGLSPPPTTPALATPPLESAKRPTRIPEPAVTLSRKVSA